MPKYFNTTSSPVQYNEDGQSVAGGEHLEVDKETDQIKAALDRGELIKFDSKGKIVYSNKVDVPEAPDDSEDDQASK